jgi:serine protease AprX
VPYVVTVGAMPDNETSNGTTDDFFSHRSSAGPIVEGFVKPEIVAPGAHMLGLLPDDSSLAPAHLDRWT